MPNALHLLAQSATETPNGLCEDPNVVCDWVLDTTGSEALAGLAGGIVAPLTQAGIVLVVTFLVGLVARWLVRRIGRRLLAGGERKGRLTDLTPGLRQTTPDPRRARRIESLVAVVSSIVTVLVWTIGVMIALGAFNINLGPLVASAGIVGIALGFGAQSLVQDFLTGLFMLAEDQFGIGDVVDAGEATGVVESISLRTTSLRAVDGTLWHVPNGQITRVGNMSQDWARAVLDIRVAYDSDLELARQVIADAAHALAGDPDFDQVVLEEPAVLGVETLAADSVDIRISIKTLPGEQWTVARSLRQRIKAGLDEANIAIPFPQRELWIRGDGQAFGGAGRDGEEPVLGEPIAED